jgi:antitoxin MazE
MPPIRAQLVKWGNSQAVRIPKTVLQQVRMEEGDQVEIRVEAGRITLEPLSPQFTLESLVSAITRDNQHQELDWGKPVGKEVW